MWTSVTLMVSDSNQEHLQVEQGDEGTDGRRTIRILAEKKGSGKQNILKKVKVWQLFKLCNV